MGKERYKRQLGWIIMPRDKENFKAFHHLFIGPVQESANYHLWTNPVCHFGKQNSAVTHPCLFIYILSMALFGTLLTQRVVCQRLQSQHNQKRILQGRFLITEKVSYKRYSKLNILTTLFSALFLKLELFLFKPLFYSPKHEDVSLQISDVRIIIIHCSHFNKGILGKSSKVQISSPALCQK